MMNKFEVVLSYSPAMTVSNEIYFVFLREFIIIDIGLKKGHDKRNLS